MSPSSWCGHPRILLKQEPRETIIGGRSANCRAAVYVGASPKIPPKIRCLPFEVKLKKFRMRDNGGVLHAKQKLDMSYNLIPHH